MQLRIMQPSLNQALQAVSSVAKADKNDLPIIGSVLLEALGNYLTVTGSDFTVSIRVECSADIQESGAICCPADTLTKLVSLLPENGIISMCIDHNHLILDCEGNQAVFKGLSADEFPPIAQVELEDTYSISPNLLHDMLASTVCCASKDDNRPILTALLFNLSADGIRLASADGYRLATCFSDVVFGEDFTAHLPRYAVEMLLKQLPEDDEVSFGFNGKHFALGYGGYQMTIASLEGQFPDYTTAIPESGDSRATIFTKDLLQAIRTVEIFAKDDSQIMRLSISEFKGVHVTGKSQAKGDAHTIMDGKITGEPTDFIFNLSLWKDILKAFPEQQVMMEFSDPQKPIVLYPPNGRGHLLYVIMPLREQK